MKTRGRGQPTAGAPTIAEEERQQAWRRGRGPWRRGRAGDIRGRGSWWRGRGGEAAFHGGNRLVGAVAARCDAVAVVKRGRGGWAAVAAASISALRVLRFILLLYYYFI